MFDDATLAPVEGLPVYARGSAGTFGSTTDADGNYRMLLDPGEYTVGFRSDFSTVTASYATEWFDNALSEATATPISVLPGATVTADAGLGPLPKVVGVVRDAATGLGVPGVTVRLTSGLLVQPLPGLRSHPLTRPASTKRPVPRGEYRIRFDGPEPVEPLRIRYLTEYFDNVPSEYEATLVSVPNVMLPDQPIVADATLERYGTISGRVTDESGNPLADVSVSVNGFGLSAATTTADGTYVLEGLPPGEYKVQFLVADVGVPRRVLRRCQLLHRSPGEGCERHDLEHRRSLDSIRVHLRSSCRHIWSTDRGPDRMGGRPHWDDGR